MGTIRTYGFLYPPFVSVRLSDSIQGLIIGEPNRGFDWGTVDAVNYNCIRTQVGKSVLFDKGEAVLVTHSADNYFLVDENKLIFQEFIIL